MQRKTGKTLQHYSELDLDSMILEIFSKCNDSILFYCRGVGLDYF